jgi:outer membrane protein
MKKFNTVSFLILFFLNFLPNSSLAETKIAFIDLDFIFKNSIVGKSINGQLKSAHQANIKQFKKDEEILKNDEKKIISKKNVLNNEEYQKLITDLRSKVASYRSDRNKKLKKLSKQRNDSKLELLSILTPMLTEYSDKNAISMIIQKKNIIIGKSELDITKNILSNLDKKIKTIKIK